jgi:hypothetical protein
MTWTIIGIPPIAANGLSGNRVDAMRAGMITMGFCGADIGVDYDDCWFVSDEARLRHFAA